jgi:Protein of unknown function (DUF2793)
MTTTRYLGLPVLYENQTQKSVSINTGFGQLDILVQLSVISRTLNAPPGVNADQDVYIVGPTPTGAWAGQAYMLAVYELLTSAWTFVTPQPGWLAWSVADNGMYVYYGGVWVAAAIDANMLALDAMSGTGVTCKTGVNTWATRTITAGTGITITNGGGIAGNPTVALTTPTIATFTLTAGATSTVVTDAACTTSSFIIAKPTTANAAADLDLMYIVEGTGSFTVYHADNALTDRTFRYAYR